MLFAQLFSNPIIFLIQIAGIVYAITIHEFAHVFSAKLQGDDTGEQLGRLTLNPLAHLDPIGILMVVFVGFGWGKPAPYNPNNLRDRKWGPVWVGLAGPLSNIISGIFFGIIAGILFKLGVKGGELFFYISLLNFGFTFFNLIPIPPLDGSKLLLALIPDTQYRLKATLEMQGQYLFFFLIALSYVGNLNIFSFIWSLGNFFTGLIIGFFV